MNTDKLADPSKERASSRRRRYIGVACWKAANQSKNGSELSLEKLALALRNEPCLSLFQGIDLKGMELSIKILLLKSLSPHVFDTTADFVIIYIRIERTKFSASLYLSLTQSIFLVDAHWGRQIYLSE